MFAHAIVNTDRPERYAKQLVSHMGRKCPTTEVAGGHRLTLQRETPPTGWFEVLVIDPATGSPVGGSVDRLVLIAQADDEERLGRVTEVVERHLVRFGEADGLGVEWITGQLPVRA